MNKTEVKERLRESIRRARINRDAGDDSEHDRILYLTDLLNRVNKMGTAELSKFVITCGLEN